jgi:translation initiation factor IF-2
MQVSGGSMSKVRIYEVAKQLNLDPKAVVSLFQAVGINEVRNHMSSVDPEAIERVKRHLEKTKTHDVVEERIRPGVLKRRAVAKPGQSSEAPPSAPRIDTTAPVRVAPPPPSSRAVASHPEVAQAERQNGQTHSAEPAHDHKVDEQPSVRELPEVPRSADDVQIEEPSSRERPSAHAATPVVEVELAQAPAEVHVSVPVSTEAEDVAPPAPEPAAVRAPEAPPSPPPVVEEPRREWPTAPSEPVGRKSVV